METEAQNSDLTCLGGHWNSILAGQGLSPRCSDPQDPSPRRHTLRASP